MPAVALPQAIETKLTQLAAGVRRVRVLRGLCWLTSVLFLLPVLAVILDAGFELSGWSRGLLLAGWMLAVGITGWWFVWRRWRQAVPAAQLASAIETRYPSLAERLRTLVELSEQADAGNGSDAMIAILARETDRRARQLNFFSAAPATFNLRLAGVTLVALVLAISPIFLMSSGGERVRRFLLPWYVPPLEISHRVVISSGDPVVRRGEPVTLSAYLEKTKPSAVLPDAAALVCRDPGTREERKLPMTGDTTAAFTVTRPITIADFEYCVEAGGVRSEWHTVSAVDSIQLAPGTTVTVRPPAYAADRIAERVQHGLGEVQALQYSRTSFAVAFDRAPTDVHLEWRQRDARPDQPPTMLPVRLAADGLSASADFELKSDGTLRWVLFGHRVLTELPVAIRVTADTPPKFERVVGVPEQSREVRPDTVLMIDLAVVDDVAVDAAEVEYVLEGAADTEIKREPLPLAGMKMPRAEGKVPFVLAGKAKVGESLRFRVRVQDSRRVPGVFPLPHEITYPATGWAVLRLSDSARPLTEQDILAKKQSIEEKLAGAKQLVSEAIQDLRGLRPATVGQPTLSADQSVRLRDDKEKAAAAAQRLLAAASEAEVSPELRPLAALARRIADESLRQAQTRLQGAGLEPRIAPRDAAIAEGQKLLEAALVSINELRESNEKLARSRLERDQFDRLAEAQQRLAAEARKPDAPLADLAAKQKELGDTLSKLSRENDTLRKARQSADQSRLAEVAERLQQLTDLQAQLNEAAKKTGSGAQKDRLDQLASRQAELNRQAAELARKTDDAARVAETAPLARQPFDQTDKLVGQEQPLDALAQQEKGARDLDRLADALSRAAKARGEAREAARQIALWQEDLRRRAADANTQHAGKLPDAARTALALEQKEIRAAIDCLSIVATAALEKIRAEASAQAAAAERQIGQDHVAADTAMKKVAEELRQLARLLLTNAQRWKASLEILDKLQKEQDAISRTASEAARAAEKSPPDDPATKADLAGKLAAAIVRQDEVAAKLRSLDTPGHTDRRDRAATAAVRAAAEMKAGRAADIKVSQMVVKRQIAWLREALDGQTPADARVSELAGLQNTLSEQLDKLATAAPDELQRLQRMQADLRQRLERFSAADFGGNAGESREAQDAVKALEAALRKRDASVDELRKKAKTAAESFDKLVDRLGGAEPRGEGKPADPPSAASRLPSAEDAQAARDLARQQRDLRGQLARAAEAGTRPQPATGKDPLADLAQEQADIAAKADELAKKARRSTAPAEVATNAATARVDAQKAADLLRAGDPAVAIATGERAASRMRAAALAAQGKPDLQRAFEDLVKRQTDLTRQVGDVGTAESITRQRNRQGEIANQASELAKAIEKANQEAADESLRQAAAAVRSATEKMEAAAREGKAGRAPAADAARQEATRDLGAASNTAKNTVRTPGTPPDASAQAAVQAAKEAAEHMAQAQGKLGTPKGAGAPESMDRAADSLRQAANRLFPSGAPADSQPAPATPDTPEGLGPLGNKPVTSDTISGIRIDALGKSWGDLPGDVKSRVTQELRARYGEDYARTISLYFEQMARRK